MNVDDEEAQIQVQIHEIKMEKSSSEKQKYDKIKNLRLSRIYGTDSSFKVITSVANTMIGSSMIVFPILFIKDGIFSSLLTLMVVCIVQYMTCRILLVHNRSDQPNFNKQILRILGYRWYLFNSIVNIVLLIFVCVGYYLLIVENFYGTTNAIINQNWYQKNYAAILTTLICIPLVFMKDIDILLKFFKYTIYSVIAFGVFIASTVLKEIIEGQADYTKFNFFSSDFSSIAGSFALSFLIHPVAAPILKKNANPNNNKRDLLLGYILTAFIYFFVGFVGSLSCSSSAQKIRDLKQGKNFQTVFACFEEKQTTKDLIFFVAGKIVQFAVLIQNLSVMPILHFLTRNQLLDFFPNLIQRKRVFFIETWIFIILSFIIGWFEINVSIILSLDGAIIGFFMVYGIPIYMHLKCYHFKIKQNQKSLLKKSILASENTSNISLITGLDVDKLMDDQDKYQNGDLFQCNQHPHRNKIPHFLLYGLIFCIGIALGIFKIYAFSIELKNQQNN